MSLTLQNNSHLREEDFESIKWLDVGDAATYLRTSPGGIRNMVYRGQLVPFKPFGKLLFKRADLDRLIEKSRRDGR